MSEAHYTSIAGGDFPPDARTLVFRGISGVECESFIRSVRFIALIEGKEDDDRWMLHFATARLSGRALRWHVRLDKEIRKDWDLLAAALLDEYPVDYDEAVPGIVLPSMSSGSAELLGPNTTSFSTVPASGRPVLEPGVQIGRIRIVPANGPPGLLYLSRDVTLISNQANAMHVQFMQSDKPHGMGILELDQYDRIYDTHRKTQLFGQKLAISSFNGGPPAFQVYSDYSPYIARLFQLDCWVVSSDFTLGVTWKGTSIGENVQTQTVAVGLYNQDCIFVANFKLWAEVSYRIQSYYEARLIFEPISGPAI